MTLWQKFQQDFPTLSRIPLVNYWAFGHWARGYTETRVA